jgi:hypothetical protein
MIRKSFTLLALALVAAAIAAPLARASSAPKVDPLAVSFLTGYGLSPSEVASWTVGACSHRVKASSCYAMLDRTPGSSLSRKIDPLAVSYLTGYGLSPSEVASWTVGACSHRVKASSCYAMLDPASVAAASTQGARSIGTAPLARRPDDRGGMLGVGATAASHPTFTRPDDLPGLRGPGGLPSVAAAHPQSAFDWSDAGIGAVTAFALALALFGGVQTFIRERRRHAAA